MKRDAVAEEVHTILAPLVLRHEIVFRLTTDTTFGVMVHSTLFGACGEPLGQAGLPSQPPEGA
jgi:hypothetical protein